MKQLVRFFRPYSHKHTTMQMQLLLIITLLLSVGVTAQVKEKAAKQRELQQQIAALDKELFDAFNACNLGKVENLFTPDLEFYHEKSGLTLTGKTAVEIMKRNLCSDSNNRVRRELIEETLLVFPINNYGAVQTGEHRFYLTQKGEKETLDGIGKFVHIWEYKDDVWKISRVISYGFRPGY